ncbi:exodeoxyribonuclease V subunit alpha [Vibrio sp. dsl-7]|uniref:RecBCD enzyme subunit RecD n=1 Tax=Vibrio chanodichtyis TaxID=3027932 RepID=A0ABT5UZL3_9VIBR|nr:exodeoxyribonuclease V subunit alpha [Vibrio chanodichtyis]MDE1514851.1 exodeoxyribonuclease V subunit alpha [Vibrio chanodichtyis]
MMFWQSEIAQRLQAQGALRPLDVQFARFIAKQAALAGHSAAESELLSVLSAALSAELGRGHICLPLNDAHGHRCDLAALIGWYGAASVPHRERWLALDWSALLQASPLVGHKGEAVPLMFDGTRLYLHRYWHYETQLAARLTELATPCRLTSSELARLRAQLDNLFARDYVGLWQALQASSPSSSLTAVERIQWLSDRLDIVAPQLLDWSAIEAVLAKAQRAADLQALDQLIAPEHCLNWQKVAAAVALTRRFAVISGGPGTGKTTTVAKLLAALISQSLAQGKVPEIKLIAPTGKAAARLTESMGKAISQLAIEPAIAAAIPSSSSTIHRLLGAIPGSAEFRHHAHNPLHLDLLVLDEASMVDLPLMVKLLEALPKHARLILLGDKDQLASVEAGAVLGDICSFISQGYSAEQGTQLAALTGFTTLKPAASHAVNPLADCLCMLQKSYRFDARSGIGQLAKAINSGVPARVNAVWQQQFSDIEHFALSGTHYQQLLHTLVQAYRPYLSLIQSPHLNSAALPASTPDMLTLAKAALDAFSRCRLLCALREGDFGVAGLNARIERALNAHKLIKSQEEIWYHGRPIMVTRNDHGLGLYNGDIGLCLRDDGDELRRLKVYFELPDGSIKAVLPSRVPQHETAYAMTIHKSQGSEFDLTLLILPPEHSPILTRELVYTGVTRAKQQLKLYCEPSVLQRAIKLSTQRASGLVVRLQQ